MKEEENQQEEFLPTWVKWIGLLVSAAISACIVVYMIGYVMDCFDKSPKDMGLSNLLLFALVCSIFFGVPWDRLGLSLKKFGPLEFERKLEGQSQENTSNIASIEDRLLALENNTNNSSKEEGSKKIQPEKDISNDILEFLEKYKRYSFSPLKMENWYDDNGDYKVFKDNPVLLRRTLRKLVANGDLDTRISKKGNTLYIFNT